jgi:methyl-accepting chemotaxis protein
MANTVYDGIDEFNETMKKVVDLVEEAKSRIQSIDDVGFGEASAKVKAIDELCEAAKKQLDESAAIAEEVLQKLGRR